MIRKVNRSECSTIFFNSSSKYDITPSIGNETLKKEKKNLRCVVCGARAFGYNFDRITCESCKGKKNENVN